MPLNCTHFQPQLSVPIEWHSGVAVHLNIQSLQNTEDHSRKRDFICLCLQVFKMDWRNARHSRIFLNYVLQYSFPSAISSGRRQASNFLLNLWWYHSMVSCLRSRPAFSACTESLRMSLSDLFCQGQSKLWSTGASLKLWYPCSLSYSRTFDNDQWRTLLNF